MLHDELAELSEPVRRKVLAHPFWEGLRAGTLDPAALGRFVEQDTGHLLPSYARALARCAAAAPDLPEVHLYGQSVVGTLEARDGLRAAYTALAADLGLPPLREGTPAHPSVLAHASFFTAATAASFHAGVGALLPMVWFNATVSDHLRDHVEPGSHYARWIEAYHPGDDYHYAVQAFLDTADRAAEGASAAEHRRLVDQFTLGVRHEWEFAESCLTAG
ncbi:Aminopyrimidine aminohydrolase [Streptomyces sp. RB5]|uniref:Aminopyrimidine aminohydrolase n=1 Tax=Streptomyces smaragdinus TaxID=2585196 RepID=A0A7K0CE24_9ACTN|nr:TenA family transcriptional regulator [Streptomyces smaragdinus]MQY11616.1 Aminopyrimidine aminohydrolase [Streptomyces smaragdinus]